MAVGDRMTYRRTERRDTVTGRRWTQLTSGKGYTYPLYFFGPTVARDGKTVVFYRYEDGQVQNWKLDLDGEEAVQLTDAKTPNCLWRFWDEPERATGVRELFSALSPSTDELIYFDSNELHAVHLHTLADRIVCELPSDRVPCALPGVSPDGQWLAMAHCDRKWWEEKTAQGCPPRHEAKRVHLSVINLQSGQIKPLVVMNSWLTHANFYDNRRVLFCHPPTESAVLITDLDGHQYRHLRTQKPEGWEVCHYVSTDRGIFYETISPGDFGVVGMIDPDTGAFSEYRTDYPVSHCGQDTTGNLWFGHAYRMKPQVESFLAYLPRVKADQLNPFTILTEGINTYGRGQRSHLHPVLMADRQNILFTGPDHTTKTNHMFLLGVGDLANVETEIL
jgi:hypothetical protein